MSSLLQGVSVLCLLSQFSHHKQSIWQLLTDTGLFLITVSMRIYTCIHFCHRISLQTQIPAMYLLKIYTYCPRIYLCPSLTACQVQHIPLRYYVVTTVLHVSHSGTLGLYSLVAFLPCYPQQSQCSWCIQCLAVSLQLVYLQITVPVLRIGQLLPGIICALIPVEAVCYILVQLFTVSTEDNYFYLNSFLFNTSHLFHANTFQLFYFMLLIVLPHFPLSNSIFFFFKSPDFSSSQGHKFSPPFLNLPGYSLLLFIKWCQIFQKDT